MVAWLGPALAAGASLLGTFMGNRQREEGQAKEMAAQKEFAQQGLRWRVEDAKAAGIHPVYALGFNGPTYSPVGLGQNDTAAGFSDAGQSIGRAIDATRTGPERVSAYDQAIQTLNLERGSLENQLLRSQIAQIQQQMSGPAFPSVGDDPYFIPGQGDSPVMHVGTPPRGTSPHVVGPGVSHTTVDEEYGDWVSDPYGGWKFLRDRIFYNDLEDRQGALDAIRKARQGSSGW